MIESASRNFVETGRGETAAFAQVGPVKDQPDQPGAAGQRGAYPSGEYGGDSAAISVCGGNNAKAAEGGIFVGSFNYGKKAG